MKVRASPSNDVPPAKDLLNVPASWQGEQDRLQEEA